MVTYKPHTLIEFGGRLAEGSGFGEIWSCRLRCLSRNTGGPMAPGSLDRVALDVAAALRTWYTAANNGMSNLATLDYVKANNIRADGHYAEPITHVFEYTPAVAGPSDATAPDFLSLCITWETGVTRGRSARGRIYLPNFTYPYQGALVALNNAQAAAQAGARLIAAIRESTNEGDLEDKLDPCVMSGIDGSFRRITGASCDTVYDVQRRRKNQAPSQRTQVYPVGA